MLFEGTVLGFNSSENEAMLNFHNRLLCKITVLDSHSNIQVKDLLLLPYAFR